MPTIHCEPSCTLNPAPKSYGCICDFDLLWAPNCCAEVGQNGTSSPLKVMKIIREILDSTIWPKYKPLCDQQHYILLCACSIYPYSFHAHLSYLCSNCSENASLDTTRNLIHPKHPNKHFFEWVSVNDNEKWPWTMFSNKLLTGWWLCNRDCFVGVNCCDWWAEWHCQKEALKSMKVR